MPLELTNEGKKLLEKLRVGCRELAKEFNINIEAPTEPFYDQHKTGFQELSHLFNFLKESNNGLVVEDFEIANKVIQNTITIDKKLKSVFVEKITKDNFKELLAIWKKDKEIPYNHLQVRAIIHVINKLLDPKFLDGCADQSSTPEKRLLAQHFKLIDNETKVPIPYLIGDFKLIQKLFNTAKELPDPKVKLVKYSGNFVVAAILDKKLPELINNLLNIIVGKQQLLAIYDNCTNHADGSNNNIQSQLKILAKKLSKLAVNDKKFFDEYSSLANEIIQQLDFSLKKAIWQNLKLKSNALCNLEDKTGLSSTITNSSLDAIKEVLLEEDMLANRGSSHENVISKIKTYLNGKYSNTLSKLNAAKNNLTNGIDEYKGNKDKRNLLQSFKSKIIEMPAPPMLNLANHTITAESIFSLQKVILNYLALSQSYFIEINELSKNIKELPGKGGSLIINFLSEIMEAAKIYSAEILVVETNANIISADSTEQSKTSPAKKKYSAIKDNLSFFKKNKIKESKAIKPKQIIELLKVINQTARDSAYVNIEVIIENFTFFAQAKALIKNISLNKIAFEKYLKKFNELLRKEKLLDYTMLAPDGFKTLGQELENIITYKEDQIISYLLNFVKNNEDANLKLFSNNMDILIQRMPDSVSNDSSDFTKAFCRNFNLIADEKFHIHAETYTELMQQLIKTKSKAQALTNTSWLTTFFEAIKENFVSIIINDENTNKAKIPLMQK